MSRISDFRGRASREELWSYVVCSTVLCVVFYYLDKALSTFPIILYLYLPKSYIRGTYQDP